MVITINEDFCLYQGASRKKDAPTYGWLNICEYYYKTTLKVFWIFPCTLLIPLPLLLDSSLSPTNGFVGSTFNVFSLTKIWRKMCIYLFCNFSEEFNCKGNVKSMYSDYASGIAFLIKTNSSIKWWKGWCHGNLCVWSCWQALYLVSCFNGMLELWPTIMR